MESRLIDLAFPYQRDFISAGQKKKIWLSSRQIGKSWSLAFIAVYKALSRKNGLSLCISTGARAAAELVKKCEQMACAANALAGNGLDYVSSADGIRFGNGSRVLSLPSGNPAALRGYSAQAVLIDECAFIERPYEVYSAILPTLTRDKDSELIVTSTPAGKSGLFWDLWNGADESWYRQKTTIEDAVRQGLKVDVDKLRGALPDPEVFDMEYMAKFADSFSEFMDLNLIDYVDSVPEGVTARWLGMDVGSTGDRTAIVTIAQTGDVFYLEDITVLRKASYEDQLGVLGNLHARNSYQAGLVDQNGIGSAVAEFAQKKVSSRIKGYTWTAQNKTPGYEAVRAAFLDHKLKICRKWKTAVELDFQNVHRVVSEAGKVSFEAGRNSQGHSDVTSALVLAMQAARGNPANFKQPVTWKMPSAFGGWSTRF